jgi:hypothetical protein
MLYDEAAMRLSTFDPVKFGLKKFTNCIIPIGLLVYLKHYNSYKNLWTF